MKRKKDNSNSDAMREEYDFSRGVRGKHDKAYRAGHTVCIRKKGATISVRYFTQKDCQES